MSPSTVLPDWAQWLAVFAPVITGIVTAAVAIAVAIVAYGQWRTARVKLALDLFERRVAVYDKVVQAVAKVMGPGRPVDDTPLRLLHTAKSEAQFLFGPEVGDFIQRIIAAVANLGLAHTMMEAEHNSGKAPGDQSKYPQLNFVSIMIVGEAEKNLAALLAGYVGFTEGLPPTISGDLAKWWKDGWTPPVPRQVAIVVVLAAAVGAALLAWMLLSMR
jgi:hypothetical protein